MAYFQEILPHQAGAATNLFVNAMRIGSTLVDLEARRDSDSATFSDQYASNRKQIP